MTAITFHLISLTGEAEELFLNLKRAEDDWFSLKGDDFRPMLSDRFHRTKAAHEELTAAWRAARSAMDREQKLPVLELSTEDTVRCELTALFEGGDRFTLTVSDGNIQEIADAWEASEKSRKFTLGRSKGTVLSWLLAHRGERITLYS